MSGLHWIIASMLATSMIAGLPRSDETKPSQQEQAEDLWRGLHGQKMTGPYLIDRKVWRLIRGSDVPAIIDLNEVRKIVDGCTVSSIAPAAREELEYKIDCKGHRKNIYFVSSDDTIMMVDIDANPVSVVSAPGL